MNAYAYRLIGVVALVAVCMFLLGDLWGVSLLSRRTPLQIVPDTRPLVPVVRLNAAEGTSFRGTVTGDARLFVNGDLVILGQSGSFALGRSAIPASAAFFGSKTGKYYYPIDGTAGQTVAMKNRRYFTTAAEAEAAGLAAH